MKPVTAAICAAIAFAVIGYFLGLSLGLDGPPTALVVGAVGSVFGLLVATVGAKALWLPLVGSVLGLIGVVVVQVVAGPTIFAMGYYVFFPLLAGVALTLLASVALQLLPSLRARIFGPHVKQQ